MHPDTNFLKTVAEEIAANPSLVDPSRPYIHLKREADQLEKLIIESLLSIENFTQRDTYHFNTLSKLVHICDILYHITGSVTADVEVLLNLMDNVRQILPAEIRPRLKLAKAFIVLQQPIFMENWLVHKEELERQGVDPELIEIAAIPFKRFHLSKHKLYWGDYTWLKSYLSKLDMMDWEHNDCNSKTEALMSLMIGREFNADPFYVYCKKYIEEREKAAANKADRIATLVACEKLVLQDTQIGIPSFDHHANRVSARLIKWIHEEIDFVETHEKERPYAKFRFAWSVEVLSAFMKLLHERKVFPNTKLEPFAEQIAANCSSIGKDEFSAATVHSRFYFKDPEVFRYIEKLLLEMLEAIRLYLK